MSFSTLIKQELIETNIKQFCCKRVFIYGLFFDAKYEGIKISVKTSSREYSEYLSKIATDYFKSDVEVFEYTVHGTYIFEIVFFSQKLADILSQIDSGENAAQALGFSCGNCMQAFLRGVFVSCATVNNPQNSYHCEFLLSNHTRAEFLYSFLSNTISSQPKIIKRKYSTGIYFKSSESIIELLTYIGTVRMLFEFMDRQIVNGIRNQENRATNCVTGNINKSITAAQRQISAIKHIKSEGRFESLLPELQETATLRLENPDASLSELSLMHKVPLTKSGLNHRLNKIILESEKIKDE